MAGPQINGGGGSAPSVGSGNDMLASVRQTNQQLEKFQADLTKEQARHQMHQAANDAIQAALSKVKAAQ